MNRESELSSAFTLVELIVVISVIVILSTFIFINYRSSENQFSLQRSANKLALDIRKIQEMAMSVREYRGSAPQGGYGVYLTTAEPASYILFADCDGEYDYDEVGNYCSGAPEKIGEDVTFEGDVEISSLSSSPLTITFTAPNPTVNINYPSGDSSATITLASGTRTKIVKVNDAGLIWAE